MNKDFRKVLAFPYIIWMAGFTIIPLSLIFIYGLTDKSGSFTFANVLAIFAGEHFKALILSISLSVVSTVICLIMAFPLTMPGILKGIITFVKVCIVFAPKSLAAFIVLSSIFSSTLYIGNTIKGR